MTLQPDGETLLSGPIVDHAALHGILDKLYGLVTQEQKDKNV